MDDQRIIELYFRRDEQAVRSSMEAYGSYCQAIAAAILQDPASYWTGKPASAQNLANNRCGLPKWEAV